MPFKTGTLDIRFIYKNNTCEVWWYARYYKTTDLQ